MSTREGEHRMWARPPVRRIESLQITHTSRSSIHEVPRSISPMVATGIALLSGILSAVAQLCARNVPITTSLSSTTS